MEKGALKIVWTVNESNLKLVVCVRFLFFLFKRAFNFQASALFLSRVYPHVSVDEKCRKKYFFGLGWDDDGVFSEENVFNLVVEKHFSF